MTSQVDYGWTFSEPDLTNAYLLEPIVALLPTLPTNCPELNLVCGNGWLGGLAGC